MQEIDLLKFYRAGKDLAELARLKTGEGVLILGTLVTAEAWLSQLLEETASLPIRDSLREATHHLMRQLRSTSDRIVGEIQAGNRDAATLTLAENNWIHRRFADFERELEHASRELNIFGVTPKGDRSIRMLLEDASKKFPPNLLAVMPADTINDVKQAGRCLAFELATACAFHICRATEALMYAYFLELSANPWPPNTPRTWHNLVNQLRAAGAPPVIMNRLGEIRNDRNSYAHPDVTVPLDEAPIVYELCTGVMFYMAKEIEALRARAGASGPPAPAASSGNP